MSSRARTTVAFLLMVLAGSCHATTDSHHIAVAQHGSLDDEAEPGKVTVDNRLDCTLRVVLTATALGSPKIVFVAPHKVGSISLQALTPASSPKLTIQALPDKEEYVIVGNAASTGVALTGTLSIVVVKFCKSPQDASGLLLEVTNELTLKTETICAVVDGSRP